MHQPLFDDVDADLATSRWSIQRRDGYAVRHQNELPGARMVYAAGIVLERKLGRPIADGMMADHWDGDPLNNRRANLREATSSQNQANRRRGQSRGVRWDSGKWRVELRVKGEYRYLGRYADREEAERVARNAHLEIWGEFSAFHPSC